MGVETASLPDAVAWGVWGAGIAMLCVGSIRNRRELKAAAASAGQASAAAGAPRAGASQAAEKDGTGSVEALVQRSDDVVASLRDLVSHGQASADYGMLPALLVRSGLMDWEGAPRFTANRLRRNRRWWMSCEVDELTEEGYDRLIALEGALNLAADLAEGACPDGTSGQERIEALFRGLAGLSPLPAPKDRPFPAGEKDGEWATRLALSEWLENLPAPFRVVSAFQLNLDEGLACVDVAVPSPSCLALVAPDDEVRQAAEARRYAWRLALLVARGAFAASSRIQRVGVNCVSHGAHETLLSLLVDRGAGQPPGRRGGCGRRARPRAELPPGRCGDGRMLPVDALLARSDERLNPASRWDAVELDPRTPPLPSARPVAPCASPDLGIGENARRVAAWNRLAGTLGATTADAVARLMETRDASEDQTVREACSRTCQALVDGAVDASDHQALAHAFVLGGPLDQAQRQALDLAGQDAGPADLERALGLLDAALVPLAQAGSYADGPTRVFRYFNSAAERVRFNRTVADGRDVVLVPDAYYAAHSLAARVLTQLGRAEEAQVHADELARVAPVTPDAALSRVRCWRPRSASSSAWTSSSTPWATPPRLARCLSASTAWPTWSGAWAETASPWPAMSAPCACTVRLPARPRRSSTSSWTASRAFLALTRRSACASSPPRASPWETPTAPGAPWRRPRPPAWTPASWESPEHTWPWPSRLTATMPCWGSTARSRP
ncbi:MAG: hypothetical protein ACLTZW_00635 [Paratractidigestivibacter faecalis]